MKTRISTLAALLGLAACAVGPDYERPSAPVPETYKESGNWLPAQPGDDCDRGAWWKIYHDPILDSLEIQIDVSNQNLKAAEAAYRQAEAIADETRASLFPTITGNASGIRAGTGVPHVAPQTSYVASANVNWVVDVWGRIRRQLESSEATAEASAADIASARLSAQASLATNYFNLRVEDQLKRLLDTTVKDDAKALKIVENQYNAGTAAKADVITAQTQLENVRAAAINTGVTRAQLEHAIAILIGKPPGDFSLAVAPSLRDTVPLVPTGMPSTLLERRPDIASAERQMAAANAQIGVAVSAYFPDITLTASYGAASTVLSKLLQGPSSLWSFGPSLAETIFDAGAREAGVEAAEAGYDQTVANYRQTVLTAFQQVEDNLASLRILADQAKVENTAVALAHHAEELTLNQYKEGIVAYTSVIVAQTTTLSTEQTALAVLASRLSASVGLIQALGGGWDTSNGLGSETK